MALKIDEHTLFPLPVPEAGIDILGFEQQKNDKQCHIRYHCCGREKEIKWGSILERVRYGYTVCNKCSWKNPERGKKPHPKHHKNEQKTDEAHTIVPPTWPMPPSALTAKSRRTPWQTTISR